MIQMCYEGRTALITGASSGIGRAFAEALARRGAHLILVARSADKLHDLATTLARHQHAVQVDVLVADLSQDNAAQHIYAEVERMNLRVDILVNCAGFATQGRFETLSPERDHQQIVVNVLAPVDLIHLFLPPMLLRGQGAIINAASAAAFQPLPNMAVYGATKAFVLSLSQALWAECRLQGVRVMALCPGATDTAFFEAIGPHAVALGPKSPPAFVVARALRALEQGHSSVVPGNLNALLVRFLWKVVPMDIIAWATERALRPKSCQQDSAENNIVALRSPSQRGNGYGPAQSALNEEREGRQHHVEQPAS